MKLARDDEASTGVGRTVLSSLGVGIAELTEEGVVSMDTLQARKVWT